MVGTEQGSLNEVAYAACRPLTLTVNPCCDQGCPIANGTRSEEAEINTRRGLGSRKGRNETLSTYGTRHQEFTGRPFCHERGSVVPRSGKASLVGPRDWDGDR